MSVGKIKQRVLTRCLLCTWMDVGGDKEVEDAAGTFSFFHFEAESHFVALAGPKLTM